jgi:hypothetical protein
MAYRDDLEAAKLVVDLDGIGAVGNTARCPRCSYLALKSG